jgi:excisionase family DNA binding protein
VAAIVSVFDLDELRRLVREEVEAALASISERRWMSVPTAAAYLDLTEDAVRRRIERGTLPAKRLGGRVLIDRKELDRMLEKSS